MLIIAVALAVAVAILRGGRVSALAEAHFRGWPLYGAAVLLQVMVALRWLPSGVQNGWPYSLSFVLLVLGALSDRKIRGMKLVVLGLVSNLLVIASNSGKMPVLMNAGRLNNDYQTTTHFAISSTKFWFLGDFIRIPVIGSHYLLLSPGDLLIALGVFIVVHALMLRKTPVDGT